MKKFILLTLLAWQIFTWPAFGAVDPRSKPNNKVGIGILSPEAEIKEASSLVNWGGDWGWVVVVIKKSERDVERWQKVFWLLSENHLIPIVRLATGFDLQGYWQRPTDEDADAWADFLSKLYWPTKNRYVQVYNEVNLAKEWGGNVDAANYAIELNKTIEDLKVKSDDFFILNAPLDLAAETSQNSLSAAVFYQTMESAVPGIFRKLDGWASHSYPNPSFVAHPLKLGRLGIAGFRWELAQIAPYLDGKNLPVFITETGWMRKTENNEGLDEETIANYYKVAFEQVWNDGRVVAVCPFIFNYPEVLYFAFSFKKNDQNVGTDRAYYSYYFALRDLPKVKGEPEMENLVSNMEIKIPSILIKNRPRKIKVSFKNIGNYIWDTKENLKVEIKAANIEAGQISWNKSEIYPREEAIATFKVKTNLEGSLPLAVAISYDNQKLAEEEIVVGSTTYLSLILRSIKW